MADVWGSSAIVKIEIGRMFEPGEGNLNVSIKSNYRPIDGISLILLIPKFDYKLT